MQQLRFACLSRGNGLQIPLVLFMSRSTSLKSFFGIGIVGERSRWRFGLRSEQGVEVRGPRRFCLGLPMHNDLVNLHLAVAREFLFRNAEILAKLRGDL